MKIQLSDHFRYKRLLRFVAPSILMLLCTSVYSIVDGFFVSNYVGKTPFAAMNLAQNLENVSELPGFAEGKFTVQDASSALAVEAAGICPGNTVMDLCAAPGGKTILAAEFAGEAGHIVSRDVSEYKTDLIRE